MTDRIQLLRDDREKNVSKEEIPVRDRAYRQAMTDHPGSLSRYSMRMDLHRR